VWPVRSRELAHRFVASLPQPIVHPISEIDRDGNRVDDSIDEQVRTARAVLQDAASTEQQQADALASLEEEIPVEFNFVRQITPEELDQFTRMGGRITWVYQAVGYGWNGVLPRGKIHQAANSMGSGFNGVIGEVPIEMHLHTATRTGRIRQQWAAGYTGSSSTTIAILDTGISSNGAAAGEVHRDFRGRQQYWKDFTSDRLPFPRDPGEHGSHVAGIALGSGEAGGVNPVTLTYSQSGHFAPDSSTAFSRAPVEIPAPSGGSGLQNLSWNGSVVWGAPGSGRTAGLRLGVYQNDVGYFALTPQARDSTGRFSLQSAPTWPQGIPVPFVGRIGDHNVNSRIFTNLVEKAAGTDWGSPEPSRRYSVTTRLSALNGHRFQLGDELPFWRGVAPNCKWAGFRVLDDRGSGSSLWLGAALDDLAVQAAANHIKVANMSLGFGGAIQSIRDKTNNAVNAGVFIAVSAGNSGPSGAVGDPGRAGKAMTVGATNSVNQLTDFTSLGSEQGVLEQGEDAIKPDILRGWRVSAGGRALAQRRAPAKPRNR